MAEESVADLILRKFEENMAAEPALQQELAKKISDSAKQNKPSKEAIEKLLKHENSGT